MEWKVYTRHCKSHPVVFKLIYKPLFISIINDNKHNKQTTFIVLS